MTSRLPALAGSIALLWSLQAFGQCTKDTDCRGDQICQQGTCVSPAPAPPTVAEPSQPAGDWAGMRKLALKVHPLITLAGLLLPLRGQGSPILFLPAELEYALAPSFSVFGLLTPLAIFTSSFGVIPGIVFGGGARFYPFADALRGFWLGGYASALVAAGGNVGLDVQAQGGYAWVFDNGFYIGLGGSLSFFALAALANGGTTLPFGILVPVGFAF